MDMKKILIVCKGHRNIAGAQLYLKHICSLFRKKDVELYFALHRADGLKFIEAISEKSDTEIVEYDWRHLSFYRSFKAGLKICREVKPDLILFNSTEDQIFAPIWAAFIAKVPRRALVVHWAQAASDLPVFSKKLWAWFPVPSRYAIKKRLSRGFGYHTLDALVFVSRVTQDAYVKLYRVPRTKCHTIYNGVESGLYYRPQLRQESRRRLKVSSDECLLLATGNLTEVKGHGYLISAVHELISHGMKVKCCIAGQGELESALKKQIEKLRLNDKVTLLGYRNDIPALLSATDIFCMPSLNEAFGFSIVEAMAAGLPIIASAVGGIPEVVSDGQDGMLVPAGDVEALAAAIEKLWHQRDLRIKMGRESFAKAAQRFDLAIMLRNTKRLFDSLLQNQ
jgi:glycosyltransferase involved in cell wall biosynthesis